MRERGGGCHQQAQNVHAAGIRQELDHLKGTNRSTFFISIKFFLIRESTIEIGKCQANFYLTQSPSSCYKAATI